MRVCSYCHNAVLRTDRGVDSLGKVADLVPIESPLRLFAEGHYGSESFLLVGMAQLRHAAGGLTQEWYARFSGTWGWLAEAQGRFYMTFEVAGAQLPSLESLHPGRQVEIDNRMYTVAELGGATYIAATGELPFKLVPQSSYRFVDLADGQGNFATIDYGGPGDTPALYVGQQVALADLHISGGEVGPSREAPITSTRLSCPNCNAPIEIRAPGQSLRAACGYCSHVLDLTQGSLRVLEKLAVKATPQIALGTSGTFSEGSLTVIGYVRRSAEIEGTWYPFDEYLLYAPEVGFRWLVDSDGHWSYVQPIAPGAVELTPNGAKYERVKFPLFASATLRVDTVVGEFYWQVKAGETVTGDDYVAPPAMLSREASGEEENWSLSTYMKIAEVKRAFGGELDLGSTTGVGANQPDPMRAATTPLTLGFFALVVLGILFAAMAPHELKFSQTIAVPVTTTGESPNAFFSDPFALEAGKNIQFKFRSPLDNDWGYVVASLVNVASGDVVTVDAAMEHYSGVDEGESWSEGDIDAEKVVGPVPAGQYVLRVEGQRGNMTTAPVELGTPPAPTLDVQTEVRQGVFRMRYLWLAFGVLGVPFLICGIYSYSFEKRRWSNSTTGTSGPKTPLALLIAILAAVLSALVLIIKAIAESSSDD